MPTESFGKWLYDKRVHAGMTQLELGKRVGISPNYISALEREEPNARDGSPRRLRLEKVDKLARALNCDLDEARLAAGYAPKSDSGTIVDIDPSTRVRLLDGKSYSPAEQEEFKTAFDTAYQIALKRIKERRERESKDEPLT